MTSDNPEPSTSEAAVFRYWANRCRKCRRDIGHHRNTCPDYDLESAGNRIKELNDEITRLKGVIRNVGADRFRWEAKFRQVVHENNQLRKALHQ